MRCKATNATGSKCTREAKFAGYCTIHFTKMMKNINWTKKRKNKKKVLQW